MPTVLTEQVPIPHQYIIVRKRGQILPRILMSSRESRTLHLLTLCWLAHRLCTPPLPVGLGGAPALPRGVSAALAHAVAAFVTGSARMVSGLASPDLSLWLAVES